MLPSPALATRPRRRLRASRAPGRRGRARHDGHPGVPVGWAAVADRAAARGRFELVGVHWRGPGAVSFRTQASPGLVAVAGAAPRPRRRPDRAEPRGAGDPPAGGSATPRGSGRRTGSSTACGAA